MDSPSKPIEPPRSLQAAFVVHFVLDVMFAVPLLIAPVAFLRALGWESVDPIASRLVAAALFGIGVESLLGRRADLRAFPNMLRLKVIWSSAAIVGLVVSVIQGVPIAWWAATGFVAVFVAFNILWSWWLVNVRRMLKKERA